MEVHEATMNWACDLRSGTSGVQIIFLQRIGLGNSYLESRKIDGRIKLGSS
jgi:hypothetical protein